MMGSILYPLLVVFLLAGGLAINKTVSLGNTLPSSLVQATSDGQTFVSYCNAVATYLQQNPSFIGSVGLSVLKSVSGNIFPNNYGDSAGNNISQIGTGVGRQIVCYATLSTQALVQALQATSYDASYGVAANGNWTSYANSVTSTLPSNANVPNGAIVSVIQVGP